MLRLSCLAPPRAQLARGLLLFALLAVLLPARGLAGEAVRPDPVTEVFTGGQMTGRSWIGWAGAVHSFTGSLYDSGWRARLAGAYGRYSYDAGPFINEAQPALFELMPGYQLRHGPLIAKVYLGLHGEQHHLATADPGHQTADMGYGVKLLSETWIDLPGRSFASLDAAYSTRNSSFEATLRAGSAKLMPQIHLGAEAAISGDIECNQLHIGGFARYALGRYSLEASGGYALDYRREGAPYVGMSLLRRF